MLKMATIDALRDLIYSRDGGLCGICGRPVDRGVMTLDHIAPRVHGGPDAVANLRTAHRSCNSRRGPGREVVGDLHPHVKRCTSPGTEVSRLFEWRDRRALTQQELADKIGLTRVALARIESGQAQPRASTTRKLAKALNVNVEDLMEPLED